MDEIIRVSDLMVPLDEYATVSQDVSLYEAVIALEKAQEERAAHRKSLVSTGDRSAKIRTYNYPQGRITDHRINKTIYSLPSFMNGDIHEMIDSLKMAENAEKLKGQEDE